MTPTDKPERSGWQYPTYAAAVYTIAVVLLGISGLMIGTLVIGFWWYVLWSRDRLHAFVTALLVTGCGMWLFAEVWPATHHARINSRHRQCLNELRFISRAIQNYASTHNGQLPPAYVANEDGRPLHSWRVLILPLLDQVALYEMYDFDEPWDGPNNRKLIPWMPEIYACPKVEQTERIEQGYTSYLAVTGEHTVWPGSGKRTLDDISHADGQSRTLLLIEDNTRPTIWTQPVDVRRGGA